MHRIHFQGTAVSGISHCPDSAGGLWWCRLMTTPQSSLEQSRSVVWPSFMAVESSRTTLGTFGRVLSLQLRAQINMVYTFKHPGHKCELKHHFCKVLCLIYISRSRKTFITDSLTLF